MKQIEANLSALKVFEAFLYLRATTVYGYCLTYENYIGLVDALFLRR